MVAVPRVWVVAMPETEPMLTTEMSELAQRPPATESVMLYTEPRHRVLLPAMGPGWRDTMTVMVA